MTSDEPRINTPDQWRQAAQEAEIMATAMAEAASVKGHLEAGKLLNAAHDMRAHAAWLEAQAQ